MIHQRALLGINMKPTSSISPHHQHLSSSFSFIALLLFQSSDNPFVYSKLPRITIHFSTLAVLVAAFTSFAFANDAAEASTDATEDVQHDYARHITNNATGTFLDLYLGQSCQKGGTAVNGW